MEVEQGESPLPSIGSRAFKSSNTFEPKANTASSVGKKEEEIKHKNKQRFKNKY